MGRRIDDALNVETPIYPTRNLVLPPRDLTFVSVLRLCVLCVSVVKFFLLRGEFVRQVLFRGS